MTQEPNARRMADAARDLQADQSADEPDVYTLASRLALENVEGATAAGLSLVRRRQSIRIRGATSDDVETIGRLQDETGEGPCLQAVWDEPLVYSSDLSDEPRFPRWAADVVEHTGVRSALSIRLFTHGDVLGALCAYSTMPRAFDEEAIDDGVALAAHVSVAVADAENIAGLRRALDSRALVGQATGVVMERYGLTASVAFSLLGRIASSEEVKIRVLAAELIDTGHLRGPAGRPLAVE